HSEYPSLPALVEHGLVVLAHDRRVVLPAPAHVADCAHARTVPRRDPDFRRSAYDLRVSAIADYRVASEANDIDALIDTLAPDAELVSPLSARLVFRGREDLRALLGAVYGSVRRLRWREGPG